MSGPRLLASIPASLLVAAVNAASPAEDPARERPAHEAPATAPARLSPTVRELIVQEMSAVQAGVGMLVPAIASGQWTVIAEVARRIQGSYVLEQRLTDEARAEIARALPAAFHDLDREFHEAAGRLAEAAARQDADVVGFYFARLMDGCVRCHGRFATERFPALAPAPRAPGHDH